MPNNQCLSLGIHTIYKINSNFFPVTRWSISECRVPIVVLDMQEAFKQCFCWFCSSLFSSQHSSQSGLLRVYIRLYQSQCLSSSCQIKVKHWKWPKEPFTIWYPHYLYVLIPYYLSILCSAPSRLTSSLFLQNARPASGAPLPGALFSQTGKRLTPFFPQVFIQIFSSKCFPGQPIL